MDLEENPLDEEEFIDEDIENEFIDNQQIEASKLSQSKVEETKASDKVQKAGNKLKYTDANQYLRKHPYKENGKKNGAEKYSDGETSSNP